MGTRNRERRRAKQHKRHLRQRGERLGTASRAGTDDRGAPEEHLMRNAVLAAAAAFRTGPEGVYRSWLERLATTEATADRASLHAAVAWCLDLGLDHAWRSGWQPADVVRALRRTLSSTHAQALQGIVAERAARRPEAATDDRWAAQVAALRADAEAHARAGPVPDLALAVEAVSLLRGLPPLPPLAATLKGAAGTAGQVPSAMLERVRALLAKAESTTFPEEGEALTAKAQELMARHAIDQVMLDAGASVGPADVVGWRIGVEDPYAAAKSVLLDRIAAANRCRAVWSKHVGFSTVFGTRSDLQMVELLFTSLLVQATDAMLRAGQHVDRWGRSRTRSFRQSFLLAYAGRIGERLAAVAADVVADGTARHGDALLPVLASRAHEVDNAVKAAYPGLVERGMAVSNHSGWGAGRAAADLASLAIGEGLPEG